MRCLIALIYIGIDDTDNADSRGTGRLSRNIAAVISKKYPVYGVTRHQLYVHEEIPYTSHNSCSVIIVDDAPVEELFEMTKDYILSDYVEGSDPGICVAEAPQVNSSVIAFGLDAKRMVLNKQTAEILARNSHIMLEGLGGTNDGIIGAIAGVGLSFTGNDGRFLLKGKNREMDGLVDVSRLLNSGIDKIMTLEGELVSDGLVYAEKGPKPSFVNGKAVLFVEKRGEGYVALKRD